MNTQLQLCSFEQTNKLKEHGFDWDTRKAFFMEKLRDERNDNNMCWNSIGKDYISRPTIQHALMWYRDKCDIKFCIDYDNKLSKYFYKIYNVMNIDNLKENFVKSDFLLLYEDVEILLLTEIQHLVLLRNKYDNLMEKTKQVLDEPRKASKAEEIYWLRKETQEFNKNKPL